MSKSRNIAFDILRIIACFLVVLYHARGFNINSYSISFINTINSTSVFVAFFLGRLGVPLFLLISGYFSFSKDLETFSFLKKRLSRIIPPFLFWLLLSTLIIGGMVNFGTNIWTLNCAGHLWYIYTLIGCLFLTPIVNPFLQKASKKELVLYLTIWGLSLVFNGNYFDQLLIYKLDNYGMSASNPVHAFIQFYGYFGYYLLGFIASRYDFPRITPIFMMSASVIIWLISAYVGRIEIHSAWFYLSVPVVLMSLGLFLSFKYLKINVCGDGLIKLSNLTFGVYLIHGIVLHFFDQWQVIHQLNNIITGLIVFLLSTVIAYLLSLLPFSKYIIG